LTDRIIAIVEIEAPVGGADGAIAVKRRSDLERDEITIRESKSVVKRAMIG